MMWPIIGHEATVELLSHSVATKRVTHAYLFTGPPAIGKFALAHTFAQALNCQQGGENAGQAEDLWGDSTAAAIRNPKSAIQNPPCGTCRACRLIAEDRHPDVRIIQMPEEKREIGIDQIRAVQHEAALKPYEGRWKVYIVRDAETLSEEAANCLLKTLEEPPPQVILLLTAPTPEALLPTIVSRCQSMPMHPLPIGQVEAALRERYACDPEKARLLARLSAGRIGWAIQAAQDKAILTQRDTLMSRLVSLSKATRVDRLAFAAEQGGRYARDVSERQEVHAVLNLWAVWWRDLILVKQGCAELAVNVDRLESLQQEAKRYSLEQARGFLATLAQAGQQLRQNVNPRLALEVLVLAVPRGL